MISTNDRLRLLSSLYIIQKLIIHLECDYYYMTLGQKKFSHYFLWICPSFVVGYLFFTFYLWRRNDIFGSWHANEDLNIFWYSNEDPKTESEEHFQPLKKRNAFSTQTKWRKISNEGKADYAVFQSTTTASFLGFLIWRMICARGRNRFFICGSS